MPEINKTFYPRSIQEWRTWLQKNHIKETKIVAIRYKKHTKKPSPSHRELMHEAICFGWIDTTVKRLDEDKYIVFFVRRNDKSRWSKNTLKYAEQMIKEKRMAPEGLKRYQEGVTRPVIDHGFAKDMPPQKELIEALNKDKIAKNNFETLAPSQKRYFIWWIEKAKRPETRKKRIKQVVELLKKNKKTMI